uniref:5-formyltetrahydrofolate cyclo-ligase n=1 Tax=uncultured bacterium Contig12 TaxID=1393397 RepID=W0FPI1_9BACT|nr:5-formyltetrahydrofolate cyclo-ligase [uncultured bacterium Contig12]
MSETEKSPQGNGIGQTIREKKKLLRREMIQRMRNLPESYVQEAGRRIQEQVLSMPAFQNAGSVFVYVSIGREPPTGGILQQALASGKSVYVPKCQGQGIMEAARIRSAEDLKPGVLGIPEPVDWSETCGPEELDLMIVPCVCAGRDGKRLGHGAGYYDRFLAGHAEKAVCLCYARLLEESIPTEETDVRIPVILTEET